jgi:hypothetical protein
VQHRPARRVPETPVGPSDADAGRWKASLTYVPLCVRLTDGQPQSPFTTTTEMKRLRRASWVSGLEAGVALVEKDKSAQGAERS